MVEFLLFGAITFTAGYVYNALVKLSHKDITDTNELETAEDVLAFLEANSVIGSEAKGLTDQLCQVMMNQKQKTLTGKEVNAEPVWHHSKGKGTPPEAMWSLVQEALSLEETDDGKLHTIRMYQKLGLSFTWFEINEIIKTLTTPEGRNTAKAILSGDVYEYEVKKNLEQIKSRSGSGGPSSV